ncbi:bifunctional ADP-dependent NAD(P)H-hydrate dehydratase/NAD(P)H-hydrate epimerase [Mucilaginibacter paludis]|uniref:Bifunctional NAD(P)H-hydrate repair enzyme n=1 Tax=Mucilaginibacter paludis DSM 18603 TaxID=714943 RepID=H1Y2V6_9SPHI|nr:bifunctional ADP-dependent NAD(P)H-hydrate dehydratase/NAD(P)H-hydrate epimerase [Mucilaginibacter paludis]EHQ28501.1 YjeF-related protein [Mucilaginibacter paludis DSM 18603]
MIPLLISSQIREADAFTIEQEPVTSVDLMERASKAFVDIFIKEFPDQDKSIVVYCGTGNNGGDGLAIARLLKRAHYPKVSVKIARFSDKASPDFKANLEKLKHTRIKLLEINAGAPLQEESSDIIIDALLGTGLNKPLQGDYARLVDALNQLNSTIVAVDVPTGFFTDGAPPAGATVLKTGLVITFQQPKINFLLPESASCMDRFKVADIGLNKSFIESLDSPYQLISKKDIRQLLKPRKSFDHKGTYGHALIIAGQQLTMGAALLCSSACAHTGAGLTTACIPESGLTALNTTLAEVMAIVRDGKNQPEIKWEKFNVVAAGPGLGTDADSLALLEKAFKEFNKPMVVDADALNMLAQKPEVLKNIPKGSIITPHMKEFDRLFGEHQSWWQRLETMRQKANELGIYILLKNRYTITGTPSGKLYFNATGNPAMASGGMGDVLTGVIASLLAQKYTSGEACIIGAYLHGKTGDELAMPHLLNTVLAGQLAKHIPVTLAKLMS